MNQRDFRKMHKLSQREFSKRVGIHEQTAWRYERNGRVPTPSIMRRIQQEFPGIDITTYYKSHPSTKGLVACAFIGLAVFLYAFPASASYEELIFCSRWYTGVHAALQASGEGDSVGAKTAQIEGRLFGYRAIAATPEGELPNAVRMIAASNDAVSRILAEGSEDDWQRVHQACGNLK